ncbi:MAG: hypothetical protein K2X87_05975 [Gemmataceae bacterium]|nr:hypothetical protein [Gemmataceae bacterium]
MLETLNPPVRADRDPPASAARPRRRIGLGLVRQLARSLPPLRVFTTLGGLLAWGHSTGWTMPKFSALAGHQEPAE